MESVHDNTKPVLAFIGVFTLLIMYAKVHIALDD